MHFGKIVKKAAYSSGHSADEFAYMMGITEVELLNLYEQQDWKSSDIRLAAQTLKYDFGNYFNHSYQFDFLPEGHDGNTEEINITIKYARGKEFLLKSWLNKMAMIAKAIGLQMGA